MEPKPVDPVKLKKFIGMKKEVKKILLSNYEHLLLSLIRRKSEESRLPVVLSPNLRSKQIKTLKL